MCGRFALFALSETLAETFGVPGGRFPAPSYNIAPSRDVTAVRVLPGGAGRELALLRWGLVPFWAKDPAIGNRLINARAETAFEKPAFREGLRLRRCLVPTSGFYEWRRRNGRKQPYFVRMRDGKVFAFAGLWERWKKPDGSVLESCAILTTDANETVAPIHDRMAVIVAPGNYDLWLDPRAQIPDMLRSILAPYPSEEMDAHPVSPRVNDPSVDDRGCIAPQE